MRHTRKLRVISFIYLLSVVVFSSRIYSQATNCDFWGTATINGSGVTSGDVIKAYDPQGVECGTAYYVEGGNYAIHVHGDDPTTTDVDEGAVSGDHITFKINGKTATVVSGSNVWTNNGSVECNLTYSAPSHSITIQTNPAGREFTVDGTSYTSAHTFSWSEGSTHTLSVSSPQSGGTGVQYVYTSWSDGGAQSHTYTVPESDAKVTANFTTQYYLTVNSAHGSPTGAGWYDKGTTATFGVTTPESGGAGTRYVFTSWTGTGTGSYTGTDTSHTVTMNNPITEDASWKIQYELTVNSDHGNPQGGGWYDKDATANFSVTSPDVQGDTRYIFQSWSGDYSGTGTSGSIIMNSPKDVTASWDTEYYLRINSEHGTKTGEGWYSESANATFSVSPTTVSGGAGTRYIFTGWTGTGTGSYTGTDASHTVTMNNPITEDASWKTQYYLTTAENPDAGGDMTPAPPGAWYDSGTDASVDATVNAGYQWAGWSGDLSGTTKPTTITMDAPKSVTANFGKEVQITVNTNPAGRSFTVDGTSYTSAQTFTWVENSTHTLSVPSPQSGGAGVQYVYTSWSDEGAQSHTYTVPGSDATVTANFKKQYQLTVNSAHGNPHGGGWYDADTTANFSVTSPDYHGSTRYVFVNWSGDYSGTSKSGSVTMDGPKSVTASWKTQYKLKVNSPHGNPHGGGWYDEGTTATFGVTSPESGGAGTRYIFTGWTGTGTGSYTGTDASHTVTMNNPITEDASWKTQYYLTTAENPDAGGDMTPAPPGAWYDSGTDASVDATVNAGYQWAGWSGDLSGTTKPTTITMDAPKSVTANFGKEVQITVNTNPAGRSFTVDDTSYTSAQTFTWVENSTHTLSVTSPQSGGTGVQYVYTSWSDEGAQSHTYTVPGSDTTVTANFKKQYQLTVNSAHGNPHGAGWYDAGSTANFSVTSPDYHGSTRYVFVNWSGDYSGTSKSGSVTMDGPKSVTANWKTQYKLKVNSSHGNPHGGGWYDENKTANFYVTTPDVQGLTRYVFVNWSGDYSGTSPSGSIVMNSGKTVTANWRTEYYLSTNENPDEGGDITPAPPGDWYNDGSIVKVQATPATGYIFTRWSGDLTGTTNPDSITMDSPKTVTANFSSGDTDPPTLRECYPNPGASSIPTNTDIEFKIVDNSDGFGVDKNSINATVNGTAIVTGGVDQTGGHVTIISHSFSYTIYYDPASDFAAGSTVTVNVTAQDLAPTANALDSTYTFTIGESRVTGTKTDTVGQNGGTITDDSTGIEITIPAGALEDSTEITIGTIDNPPTLPDSINGVGLAYHFWPDGLQFTDSITIRIPYTQDDLDSAGVTDPMDLPVYYFSTTEGKWIKLTVINADNAYIYVKVKKFCYLTLGRIITTGVGERELDMTVPSDFVLMQNYPNPFNPTTTITYSIPQQKNVVLEVFNVKGDKIATLVNGRVSAGTYTVTWDGKDGLGRSVPSGIYLCKIQAGAYQHTIRMLLLK